MCMLSMEEGSHLASTWLDSIVEIPYIYCLSLKIVKLYRK